MVKIIASFVGVGAVLCLFLFGVFCAVVDLMIQILTRIIGCFVCGSAAAQTVDLCQERMLGLWLILPFLGLLLSIASVPMLRPCFWERHYWKCVLFWVAAFFIPMLVLQDAQSAWAFFWAVMSKEYVPFALLVSTLYVITSNIKVGHLYQGSPLKNTIYLMCAGLCASIAGTTGAAMIFIRPYLSANEDRRYMAHAVIFFIFLVANVGGALTPLGDPPLFLGFLNGVPFFWPLKNLLFPTLLAFGMLLLMFYFLDRYFYRREGARVQTKMNKLTVAGKHNIGILLCVIALLVISGHMNGQGVEYADVIRDVGLVVCAVFSYITTSAKVRRDNRFSWHPLCEVLAVFFGLFLLVAPALVLFMKKHDSVMPLLQWFTDCPEGVASRYFWGTGVFSSFLDNAPTYLVFAHMTGVNMMDLVNHMPKFLAAISCGAVFMGAMTYIGNAPNFMVKAIVEEKNIKIPGFFGYMAWSCAFLLPVLMLVDCVFFSGWLPFVRL